MDTCGAPWWSHLAAEEIFALFERTIAEYEDELCRCKEESHRKRQPLDHVWNPRILLHRAGAEVRIPSPCPAPDPGVNLETTETALVKEEPEEESIKEEGEHPPVFLPESSAVCLKSQGPSLLLQTQTDHQEETQGEEITPEPLFLSQTEINSEHSSDTDDDDDDDDWANRSAAQMETEPHADHYDQDPITERSTSALLAGLFPTVKSVPDTSAAVNNGNMLGTGKGANKTCSICQKSFRRNTELHRHIRVHTGEKPYSCSICYKAFNQKIHLEVHMRTHNGERPYSCSHCAKTFTQKIHLEVHQRTHSGTRPYRCTVCRRTFNQYVSCQKHMMIHTKQKQSVTQLSCVTEGLSFIDELK